jgi:hypothetical protein
MIEQTGSYSIEMQDQATRQVTIFTFVDVTAEEVQTVLDEFRHLFTDMAAAVVINVVASTRASMAPDV